MSKRIRLVLVAFIGLWGASDSAQTNLEISAPASWETFDGGRSVRLEVDRIRNLSPNRTSGTVHIILRATATPEIVGSGYTLAEINMANYADDAGRLGPGEGWVNIGISVPFDAPPNGTYYTHLAVVEYPNLTTVLDHLTFSGTTTWGSGTPPPPTPPPPSGDDHGDTFGSATIVSPISNTSGRLEAAGDRDIFRITVPESGFLGVSTSGSTDTVGALYDSAQILLAQNDDSGADGRNFSFATGVPAGTYYVVVTGFDNAATGSYSLIVDFQPDSSTTPPPDRDRDKTSEGGGSFGWFSLMMLALGAVARRRKS